MPVMPRNKKAQKISGSIMKNKSYNNSSKDGYGSLSVDKKDNDHRESQFHKDIRTMIKR